MPDPGRAVYELWTSPNHAPMPDHLPTLIVTPAGRPQNILYTFLHTNYNQENYLLTPSASGDLCVAKLFPSGAITGGKSFGGQDVPPKMKNVDCQASRSLKWRMTNTGIAMPTYKLTIPNPDLDDPMGEQPLFQVSKPNPHAPFWTLWYYTYAGHLIPPRRVEFGRVEKTAPPGSKGAGGTRVIVTGKTDEEKAVWKTLGHGNEDMVEWIVLCAALNVLDDEIRDAAKNAGQPLRPPPAPGSARAQQQAQMVVPPMRRTSRDNAPPPRAKSLYSPNFLEMAAAANGGGGSVSQDRRPQAPPQQAQQDAYARQQQQQQLQNGGQHMHQPPPRSMEQSMQGLRIDPRVAQQQGGRSGMPSPMNGAMPRPSPPHQQQQFLQQQQQQHPSHIYSPPARQASGAAAAATGAAYSLRDRTQSTPHQRPQQSMTAEAARQQNGYGMPQGSSSAGPGGGRRDISGPAAISSERSLPGSNGASPPRPSGGGGGNPLYGARSPSPLLPPVASGFGGGSAGGPNGPRGPLGPPRPGALQAQSGSIPQGPRKMPSTANLRTRSPQPPVDPNILPDSMQPRRQSPPASSPTTTSSSGADSRGGFSPTSPTKGSGGGGIPDSLRPTRTQPKAVPALFEDSELAYAS